MPLYEPLIPARYAAPLLDFLNAQDLESPASVLAAAKLQQRDIVGTEAILTMTQFDALHCAIRQHLGRDDLGFELGNRISMDDHRALSLALRQCGTLNEMLHMVVRYSRLLTPCFFFNYTRHSDQGELTIRPAAGMSQATLRAFEELFAVSFHRDFTALLGTRDRLNIFMSMPAPAHLSRYRRLRPTRFHFAALPLPEVRCVFPGNCLDVPLLRRTPGSDHSMPPDAAELQTAQSNISQNHQWGAWVRLLLSEAEGCQPSRKQLAELANVSETALTRNLAREGQNLRAIGHAIRVERACQMLRESGQSIGQIAYRLGYNDVANFSNTFRAAVGASPREYRGAQVESTT
jgi:AraC-like DNA-binding protein